FPNTPFDQPYLSSLVAQQTGRKTTRRWLATTADYKLTANDRLSFGLQYSSFDVILDHSTLTLDTGRVLPGQFSLTSTKGAVGGGTSQLGTTSSLRNNWTYMPPLVWRHDGPVWKMDAGAAISRSRNRTRNVEDGLFASTTSRRTNLTVAFDDIGYYRPRVVTVTDGTTGAPVDLF